MVVDAGGAGGVELRFPGREVLGKAARGDDIGLNKEEVVFWKEEAVAIGVAYEGLLRVLVEGQAKV